MAVELSSWIGACVTQRIPKPLQDWEQVASCRCQTPSQDHYRRWPPEKQTSSQWRRSLHRRIIILKDMNPLTEPAVGDIVVEKLSSNGVTSENKTIYTPRLLHSKLGYLLFSTGRSNSDITLHGGSGGEKVLFPLCRLEKVREAF